MSHPLLTAPILPSLLRLAGPTTAIMAVQILVAIAETWIVGRLGTEALAGFALVFPFLVLTLNLANGGMGGAVAAALARSLGGGRTDDARALVLHAAIVAMAFGIAFTILAWTAAPHLYALMGGSGHVLRQAIVFGDIWFAAAAPAWVGAFFAALLRGSGEAKAPARYGLLTALLYVLLAAVLALGLGDWPGLGIAGVAIASGVATIFSVALLTRALLAGRLGFVPGFAGVRLQRRLFREILAVGLFGSVSTIAAILTATLVTGLVGRFGVAALAGYGIGMRIEFMLAPLAFGIGSGLTTLVGVAAGASDWRRAVHVAWVGGLLAFGCIGVLGWSTALLPETWSRLFTADTDVIAASVACITRVAPFYCLFGLGLTLNFASQGAGRMTVPLLASLLRMAIATAGGWLAVEKFGLGLDGIFTAIGTGLAVYGCVIAGTLALAPWRSRDALPHGA